PRGGFSPSRVFPERPRCMPRSATTLRRARPGRVSRRGPSLPCPFRPCAITQAEALLDIGPALEPGDLLETLEIHAVVAVCRPSRLEIGERVLDRARDPENERRRIGDHGEAETKKLVCRQHRRASATLDHV